MSVTIMIDGSSHSGMFRVQCDCGDYWTGRGEALGGLRWNPVLAVAESVVHARRDHAGVTLDVRFSRRFTEWLLSYWEQHSLRVARARSLGLPALDSM